MNNETSVSQPAAAPEAAPVSHMKLIWSLAAAVILLGLAGALYYFKGGMVPAADTDPKTVGIIYFRQQLRAVEGFKAQLGELGYSNITFKDVEITLNPNFMDDIKRETEKMLDEKVDLIFASFEHHAKTAVDVTKARNDSTPIVFMTRFHDPVEYGIVSSYKFPGGNATGVATDLIEIVGKTLSFLKEIDPSIQKIGVFGEGFMIPGVGVRFYEEVKKQAPKLGLAIVEYKTSVPPPQVEAAWRETAAKIKEGDIDALFHIAGHFFEAHDGMPGQETAEYELAKRLKIPHTAPLEDLPGGGHFSYSNDDFFAGKQAGVMAHKIFTGTKPADIPVEFGAQNDLTLHLKRAREDGIVFPNSMLFIAKTKIEE